MLGSVYRVLWATPLCRNEESTRIHTGKGNKNTTKFATYVFIGSQFPSHTINTPFYFLTFLMNLSDYLLSHRGHSNLQEGSREMRYTSPSALSYKHPYPSFSLSFFPLSHSLTCELSLYLFIICAVESRLASAVLAAHLSPTAVLQTSRLCQPCYFKSALFPSFQSIWSRFSHISNLLLDVRGFHRLFLLGFESKPTLLLSLPTVWCIHLNHLHQRCQVMLSFTKT